ncbi:hypothetical protein HGO23_11420 [Xenorhabdus budapestensis]|uniref:Uncharacterized protein n=1 Tax=Xenorhabdus budapestensis TaxID=290110 RepID=A0ABX7VFB2_XENBU|nr:hypothetical protein [Xenorhabdus budapestensis]QTL38517.1 hypothetical protein HGO23_11420 [Xenorhabdus budapestensis]
MKQSASMERSKLQLTMMSRLHDVFSDVKKEVEITPEFIQDTLAQFMQMATGSNYHIEKSVRIGFGEVQAQPQVQAQSVVDTVKKALNTAESMTPFKNLFVCTSTVEGKNNDSVHHVKLLGAVEKADLVQDISRVIKNHHDIGQVIHIDDLQSVLDVIHTLARKEVEIIKSSQMPINFVKPY